MPKQQLVTTIHRLSRYLVIGLIGFGFLAMFSYIYDLVTSEQALKVSSDEQPAVANLQPTATLAQPTQTLTPTISDYRAILLLERATDLIVRYIEKVRAGEIDPNDDSVKYSYIEAFPVAIDAYNLAIPTAGLEHGWKNVIKVARAYTLVYPALQQGKMISDNDLFNIKSWRQWLINYRNTEESVLTSKGFSNQFLTTEKEAVEKLLQESYGSMPVPPIEP